MLDAWRLALGTLTAFPVRPPQDVDTRTARMAVLVAPLAAGPLGFAVAATLWVAGQLDVTPLAAGLLAVGVLVLGTRAFHVDGLADTADGLTASYDRERSLAVMKSGSVGPAGAAAIFIVLGMQAVGFAGLSDHAVAAGVLVCLSRTVLALACMQGVRAAEGGGLRSPFAQSVPQPLAIGAWLAAALVGVVLLGWIGLAWQDVALGFALATAVTILLLRRAIKRLGGITGDIFGASIELTLAALLVTL